MIPQGFSRSLTQKFPGQIREIRTNIQVSEAFDPTDGTSPPELKFYVGLWDTGATSSSISQRVVDELSLAPIGFGTVHHANGKTKTPFYLINLRLPHGVIIPNIKAALAVLYDFDMLIGMEVITLGDFCLTCHDGETTFSYRTPSSGDFDFVRQEAERRKKAAIGANKHIEPNQKCPCGSGKKYKRCCGRNGSTQPQN